MGYYPACTELKYVDVARRGIGGGIPEIIFEKFDFEKNQQTTAKAWDITQHARS